MKHSFRAFCYVLTLLFGLGLSFTACSTVSVLIPVTRPAEINLKGKNEIVVDHIKGEGGEQIADLIREKLSESEHIKIVDRQHLDEILNELRLSSSDLANPGNQLKLGRLLTGATLISGRMDAYDTSDEVTTKKVICERYKDGNVIKYPCQQHTRTGTTSVRTSFSVIDIESARNLKTKLLSCQKSRQTQSWDEPPREIDIDEMRQKCSRKIVNEFIKTISPWTETIMVSFRKNKNLPTLETGINFAKIGYWDDAVASFQQAIDAAATDPEIKASVAAMAHWNMGLALEYSGRYDEAIGEIKKASALSNNADYLLEIENINGLKLNQARLKEQLSDLDNADDSSVD